MEFVVETDIPLPKRKWARPSEENQYLGGQKPLYPFAQMNVGDSFVFCAKPGESVDTALRRMSGTAGKWGKNSNRNIKFALRCVDAQTVRIWRVS